MSAEWIDAEHDEAAVEAAKEFMDGAPRYELWANARLVIRFDRKGEP